MVRTAKKNGEGQQMHEQKREVVYWILRWREREEGLACHLHRLSLEEKKGEERDGHAQRSDWRDRAVSAGVNLILFGLFERFNDSEYTEGSIRNNETQPRTRMNQ